MIMQRLKASSGYSKGNELTGEITEPAQNPELTYLIILNDSTTRGKSVS